MNTSMSMDAVTPCMAGERAAAFNKMVLTNEAPFRVLTQDKQDIAILTFLLFPIPTYLTDDVNFDHVPDVLLIWIAELQEMQEILTAFGHERRYP